MDAPDRPKTLADDFALEHRRSLLAAPHMAPLNPFVARLRDAHGEVPDPDPLDGGAEARLLLLLETPGPRIRRSFFVSRDNPSGTAANLFRFLTQAGIPRRDTLIWNAVPFVIHAPGAKNRAPREPEIAAGLGCLPPLLALLPRLAVAVLAGRIAARAAPVIAAERPEVALLAMPHPSPTYLCTDPAHPARIRAVLAEAAERLRAPGS
ncbi:MAG TPA: uracil-DNA glycosylase family protein [Beijerinckiaceae bacterium]|jgi:uracil-DNA glycosylase